jgi:hypothetical protein
VRRFTGTQVHRPSATVRLLHAFVRRLPLRLSSLRRAFPGICAVEPRRFINLVGAMIDDYCKQTEPDGNIQPQPEVEETNEITNID